MVRVRGALAWGVDKPTVVGIPELLLRWTEVLMEVLSTR
jgi:hypothetical protein